MDNSRRLTVEKARELLSAHGLTHLGRGKWMDTDTPCPLGLLLTDKIPADDKRHLFLWEGLKEFISSPLVDLITLSHFYCYGIGIYVGLTEDYTFGLNNGFEEGNGVDDQKLLFNPDSEDYKEGFADGQALTELIQ